VEAMAEYQVNGHFIMRGENIPSKDKKTGLITLIERLGNVWDSVMITS